MQLHWPVWPLRDIADDAGTVAKRPATGHLQQLAANKSIASGSGATVDEVLAFKYAEFVRSF